MDVRKVRLAKRRRFAAVLGKYREQHGLSLQQLSELLGKPRSTVHHWLTGKRMPQATDLRRLCSRVNINFEVLFSDKTARDVFFETQIVGLDAIQLRYLEVKQEDALDALDYLAMTGALVFNRMIRAGIECRLEVKPDYTVWIRFLEDGLKDLTMLVQAKGLEGIGFSVIQSDNALRFPWRPATKANLDSLIDILTSYVTS